MSCKKSISLILGYSIRLTKQKQITAALCQIMHKNQDASVIVFIIALIVVLKFKLNRIMSSVELPTLSFYHLKWQKLSILILWHFFATFHTRSQSRHVVLRCYNRFRLVGGVWYSPLG